MNNHVLIIEQRSRMRISAVKSTERFGNDEVLVYTECGDLLIKGNELEVLSCSESSGEVEVTGRINSAVYLSEKYHIPDNFLAKLFK